MTDELKPCPHCGATLDEVRQSPDSMLNAEQFDAAKRGDWFCTRCPPLGATYRYFWTRDLKPALAADARALLAAGASEGQADHPLDIRAYIVTDRSSGAKALKWAAELGNRFPSELYQLIPLTHHADAVAELTALRERIAGMEKDAERYRRIRLGLSDQHGDVYAMIFAPDGDTPERGEKLDAAVDAAIAKEKNDGRE